MTESGKARIIRGWLLLAACVVAFLLWPDWRLLIGVPLFLFPTCDCCGPELCTCSFCDGGEATCNLVAQIAGMGNGSCSSCSELNAVWVLPGIAEIGGSCTWEYIWTGTCSYGTITANVTSTLATVSLVSGGVFNTRWLNLGIGTDCQDWANESIANVNVGTICISDGTAVLVSAET